MMSRSVCLCQGQCIGTLSGHDDEVLDVTFDYTGQYLLTASADSTARLYNVATQQLLTKLEGHEGEISKVSDLVVCTFVDIYRTFLDICFFNTNLYN